MERLSPQDTAFLHIEAEPANHMHIGSVSIFEGPTPPFEEIRQMVVGRLPLVPRYRQRLRRVPLDAGRPVLVADPHFHMDYHLRNTALPQPGGIEQLENLVGRVMSQRLDHSRPLWELWVVEGLGDGRWAMIAKVHHALVDGIAGTDLVMHLFEEQPEPGDPVPDDWAPASEPSSAELLTDALRDYLSSPVEQWRAARAAVRRPLRLARSVRDQVQDNMRGAARPEGTGSAHSGIGSGRPDRAASTLGVVHGLPRRCEEDPCGAGGYGQ
jgi:diacylglycerol O-acyltransferase / wax synthase